MRNGVLRVSIGFWTAEFVVQEGEAITRMRDGFHEGMARLITERLGVRTEILSAHQSGDGVRRLLAGQADLALAPPITRGLIRNIMFCTPHLSQDLVVVTHGGATSIRRQADLQGMRLATLTIMADALAERGTLGALPHVIPIPTPWLLLRGVLDGLADGVVVTRMMADAMIRRFPEAGLRAQHALATSIFAGAVAYGAHDLMRAINTIVEELQLSGSLAALFRRETGMPFIRPFPN